MSRFEKLYEPDVNGNELRRFYSDGFVVLIQIEVKDKPGNIDTKCHWLERETVDLANNQKIEVKIESEI